jgi:hypothetical protein
LVLLRQRAPRLHTSAYVSTYVGIRQHASAYVSIRQHTSAYVSMRELRQGAPYLWCRRLLGHLQEASCSSFDLGVGHDSSAPQIHRLTRQSLERRRGPTRWRHIPQVCKRRVGGV